MSRVRRTDDRAAAIQEYAEQVAAEALGQSEPGLPKPIVHVWPDDKPPRYPAVGLHPGAIDGTVPHRCRLVMRG